MALTTPDVIGLLLLCLVFIGFAAWIVYVDRVLRDPDHPEHELAKEAVKEGFRQAERDRLRFE